MKRLERCDPKIIIGTRMICDGEFLAGYAIRIHAIAGQNPLSSAGSSLDSQQVYARIHDLQAVPNPARKEGYFDLKSFLLNDTLPAPWTSQAQNDYPQLT